MSELVITKERVLRAARKNPQSKELLSELFPEVFELEDEHEVFCFSSDLFVRKNSNGILGFQINKQSGHLYVVNVRDKRPWSTSIPKNQVKNGCALREVAITKGDMRKLLKGASGRLEDVYVIQKSDIDRLKENIK